ncbi:MAG: zinc ribbon domain-containing protein [Victivallales bacterium]|nr:zinc ribbon domain-containing protein [Victivallales bacterium]
MNHKTTIHEPLMPIYEYQCEKCGHRFSHLHRRLGEAAPACPKCGGEVKKLFSSFAASASSGGDGCPQAESCPMSGGHSHGAGCGCGCCGGHHHH